MVELACLENKCAFMGTEGSNPSLSAKDIVPKRPIHLKTYKRCVGSFNLAQNVIKHPFPFTRAMRFELT